ncbi:MAG: hypothetical protein QOJ22_172, partial [Thermoleophilaceae bacterium]|nr:hypothetical protein [Thermoleophilaceae bacterium]
MSATSVPLPRSARRTLRGRWSNPWG